MSEPYPWPKKWVLSRYEPIVGVSAALFYYVVLPQ